jgi:hypothetical protein
MSLKYLSLDFWKAPILSVRNNTTKRKRLKNEE